MSPCLITADPAKHLSFPPCSTPSDIERGYKKFFHVMPCLSVVSITRRTGDKPYRKHSLILPWEVSTPVQFAVLLRHWREKNGSNWFLREETGVNSSNRNFRVACLKNTTSLILEINVKVLQKKQYRLFRAICLACKQTSCLFGQEHVLPSGVRGGEELLTSELHGWHTAEESGAALHCRSHS